MDDHSATALLLTGERRNRRFLVRICGKPIWLSSTLFTCLCELVLARGRTASGFVQMSPMTIYRLRRVINRALGDRAVDDLIQTGADKEYRLNLGIAEVMLENAFVEIRDKSLLAAHDMDYLIHSCCKMKSR